MDIGGCDMVLPGTVTRDDLDVLLWRVLRQHPDAQWESLKETKGSRVCLLWDTPYAAPWVEDEFFIHWGGGDLHVLTKRDCLTLVVDPYYLPMVEDIFRAIKAMRGAPTPQ